MRVQIFRLGLVKLDLIKEVKWAFRTCGRTSRSEYSTIFLSIQFTLKVRM